MQRHLAILFTSLYILAMLKPVMPLFQYVVNQDYIAEFLCVNKDKPMLNCKGKCFLAAQLAKESEEKKQNLPAINLQEYPIGFIHILSVPFLKQNIATKKVYSYVNLYKPLFLQQVFHPPSF